MKKNVIFFAVTVIVVVILIITGRQSGLNTAGGGFSLKKANDTTKVTFIGIAETNITNSQQLAQVTTVANWEHQWGNGFWVGADVIGTASTQFGIMCPTYDMRCGLDFKAFRLEAKVGNFTRNGVKAEGLDPQFMNFCILQGESASVSNAVQVSLIAKDTKIMLGHQAGEKFYTFNSGNYYIAAEQSIKNFTVGGGVEFTEKTGGYAAVRWRNKNNVLNLSGNKLGTDNQNFILSYNHNNIDLGKGVMMSVGGAFWGQAQKQGLNLVTGFGKGRAKLFAEVGGLRTIDGLQPVFGAGMSFKL